MKKLLLICSILCLVSTITMAQSSRKKTTTSKVSKKPVQRKKSTVATAKKKPGYLAYNSKRKKTTSKNSRNSAARKITSFAANPKKSSVQLSPEDQLIATDFAKSRGKLPWPVDGTVSLPYGDYVIEETTIKGRNPGITISTPDKDMPVKAVFDGVVADVDGNDELATVYIRHGNYYTVYSNLSAIHVKKGALVKMGEAIGSVGEAYSDNGGGELMFVVMAETDNVNPAVWLKK